MSRGIGKQPRLSFDNIVIFKILLNDLHFLVRSLRGPKRYVLYYKVLYVWTFHTYSPKNDITELNEFYKIRIYVVDIN